MRGIGHAQEGPEGEASAKIPLQVFVSYRREDTADAAGRLYDALKGSFELFMDIDTIGPGEDYPQVIRDAVGSCDVLLALMGRQWLTVEDDAGRPRLEADDDWVRLEIQAALDRDLRVIPILLQEASMPSPEQLPSSLSRLAHKHAHKISNERWYYDVGLLVEALEKVRAAKMPQPPPEPDHGEREDGEKERRRRDRILRSRGVKGAGVVLGGLVVLGAALWLLRGDGSSFRWTDISSQLQTGPRGEVNAVITFPDDRRPYVAAGREGRHAALWTSADGVTWQPNRSEAFKAAEGEVNLRISFLMPRAPGAIAVGERKTPEGTDVVIWTSDDLSEWTRGGAELELDGNQFATSVLRGRDERLFLAGCEGTFLSRCEGSVPGGRAVMARSLDEGRSWEWVTDQDFETRTAAAITRILCLDRCNTLVAVGWVRDEDGSEDAMAWTSPTGESDSWAPRPIEDEGDQRIIDAAPFGSRMVAVGYHEDDGTAARFAVWLSSDGMRWTPELGPETDVSSRAEVVVDRQTDDGPRLIAAGSRGEPGSRHAAVWTSEDGRTWRLEKGSGDVFSGADDQRIVDLAARRLPLIAVGERGDGIGAWCGGDCLSGMEP